jgi:hypothetical protein
VVVILANLVADHETGRAVDGQRFGPPQAAIDD